MHCFPVQPLSHLQTSKSTQSPLLEQLETLWHVGTILQSGPTVLKLNHEKVRIHIPQEGTRTKTFLEFKMSSYWEPFLDLKFLVDLGGNIVMVVLFFTVSGLRSGHLDVLRPVSAS